MIFTQPNEEMRAQIEDAIKIVDEHHHRSSPGWSERYGHAFAFLFQILERDLKEWVKANPPGHADYDKSTPMRAVYLYADQIHPNFRTVHDVLLTNRTFEKIVIKALQSVKSSSSLLTPRGEGPVHGTVCPGEDLDETPPCLLKKIHENLLRARNLAGR